MLKFDSQIVLILLNRIVKLYSMVTDEIIVELLNFQLKDNLFQLLKTKDLEISLLILL